MAKNNSVRMIGNLTADPISRTFDYKGGQRTVTNYDIAVHSGDRTDYFRVASWGKQAENDAKYLKKGNMVMIDGDLQTGSYEKDGVKIPTLTINTQDVTYLMPASTKKAETGAESAADGAEFGE